MTLYYQDELVELHHGDCLDVDAWLQGDVAVTDPPYGMAFVSSRTTQRRPVTNDHDATARDAALELWGDKPAAVFGTWRIPRPAEASQVLIWDKQGAGPGMGDLTLAFGTSHEEIYLLGRWEKQRAKRRGSVLSTYSSPSNLTTKIGHPTPKPIGLIEMLVEVAPPGIIVDPFAGSGSTLLAARNLGRRAIGVEIEERYCELIVEQLGRISFDWNSA